MGAFLMYLGSAPNLAANVPFIDGARVLRNLLGYCLLVALASCSREVKPAGETAHFMTDNTEVLVTPTSGPAKKVRLVVLSPKVIRVTAFPT